MKEQPISFPLTNAEFLKVISNSFCRFLRVETSRSPEKLKPLHGAIAADLSRRLGEGYHVCSQGFGLGEEFTVRGRYVPKRVDITIFKQDKVAAGVAVKFVMQNYSQNSMQNVKLNHYIAVFERVVLLCKICEQQTSNRIESLAIESGCIRE